MRRLGSSIQFRHKDGTWDWILRKGFTFLTHEIKRGKVDALNAETISAKETTILGREGFALVPDEIVVGIGNARQLIKILKIESS